MVLSEHFCTVSAHSRAALPWDVLRDLLVALCCLSVKILGAAFSVVHHHLLVTTISTLNCYCRALGALKAEGLILLSFKLMGILPFIQ